jgi:para-nitrobenzyl esterase
MPNVSSPTGYFQPLAAHTIDIQFLFKGYHGGNLGVNLSQDSISPANNQPRELQGAEIALSNQLIAAWTNFAKTGNPNGVGALVWPVFAQASQTFLSQNLTSSAYSGSQFYTDHKCAFWYPRLGYPTS